ncbi:hypothetical protein EKPJFOCH_1204 [Methylobacterium thuringiense]|uniref:Uncharacterized protein n=1 Tax=Methylobacterium thuringiense TaxID=1003091 RepID=A0ABQ4TJE5_9HYPH|nr:hypothetical protein EKPJFOCH_1204 [Methylobacterium thuringiense]
MNAQAGPGSRDRPSEGFTVGEPPAFGARRNE